jgi:hypothetical protein
LRLCLSLSAMGGREGGRDGWMEGVNCRWKPVREIGDEILIFTQSLPINLLPYSSQKNKKKTLVYWLIFSIPWGMWVHAWFLLSILPFLPYVPYCSFLALTTRQRLSVKSFDCWQLPPLFYFILFFSSFIPSF